MQPESTRIHPVILCGGSGTRLWPLSRQQFPKQFVPLMQGKNLLTLTAERLKPLLQQAKASDTTSMASGNLVDINLVTAAEHRFLARDAVAQAGGRIEL